MELDSAFQLVENTTKSIDRFSKTIMVLSLRAEVNPTSRHVDLTQAEKQLKDVSKECIRMITTLANRVDLELAQPSTVNQHQLSSWKRKLHDMFKQLS